MPLLPPLLLRGRVRTHHLLLLLLPPCVCAGECIALPQLGQHQRLGPRGRPGRAPPEVTVCLCSRGRCGTWRAGRGGQLRHHQRAPAPPPPAAAAAAAAGPAARLWAVGPGARGAPASSAAAAAAAAAPAGIARAAGAPAAAGGAAPRRRRFLPLALPDRQCERGQQRRRPRGEPAWQPAAEPWGPPWACLASWDVASGLGVGPGPAAPAARRRRPAGVSPPAAAAAAAPNGATGHQCGRPWVCRPGHHERPPRWPTWLWEPAGAAPRGRHAASPGLRRCLLGSCSGRSSGAISRAGWANLLGPQLTCLLGGMPGCRLGHGPFVSSTWAACSAGGVLPGVRTPSLVGAP